MKKILLSLLLPATFIQVSATDFDSSDKEDLGQIKFAPESIEQDEYESIIYVPGDNPIPVYFTSKERLQEFLMGENRIVEFEEEVPEDWAELDNVIVNGVANRIILSNKAEYGYNGKGFTAKKVEFTYYFETKADKNGGWNSLVIPFTGEPEIVPLTEATKKSGKYWAKKYVGSTATDLIFKNLDEPIFEANQAYLLAFPGESYGSNEYPGNALTISAENAELHSNYQKPIYNGMYAMAPNYQSKSSFCYILNPQENKFIYHKESTDCTPFSAKVYHKTKSAAAPRSLGILDEEQNLTKAMSIEANSSVAVYSEEGAIVIRAEKSGVTSIYNLNGAIVKRNLKYDEGETRITGLSAGAYIVAGQVVILR